MHFVHAQRDPGQPEPTPEQLAALHRRMGQPDNEVPGTIQFHAVVGRTDEFAVVIAGVQAFSTGISIRIAIRLRTSDPSSEGFGVFGHHGHGALLIGVAYPDGRTASNVHSEPFGDPFPVEDQPSLLEGGVVAGSQASIWTTG